MILSARRTDAAYERIGAEMDILQKIENGMPTFSKGQRAIAAYILEHYDKAAYMTALKLGSTVHVSESTVVRFAIELGLDGYPELQRSLRELIRTRLTTLQRIDIANERIGQDDIIDAVMNFDIEKMRTTLDCINRAAFESAVDNIVSARRVYIAGVRSSSALAMFLHHYLSLIFDDVRLINNTARSDIYEHLFRINENDVLIGISFPRYSKRLVEEMNFAKKKNAYTVAITDSETSPIAASADSVLVARSEMASFVDSLVAPMSVINAMIVAIGVRKQEEVRATFTALEDIWDEYDVYDKDRAGKDENK